MRKLIRFAVITLFVVSSVLFSLTGPARAQTARVYMDLHDFDGATDGRYPGHAVTFDSAGNMYGVTTTTVWEMTASGAYKILHTFIMTANGVSLDDSGPSSSIVFDKAGNMYGTTVEGGAYATLSPSNGGTVWEITKSGSVFTIHNFGGSVINADGIQGPDGQFPEGITIDASGNLYGTTPNGGANSGGILWEITSNGLYKDLHDFGGPTVNEAGWGTAPDGIAPTEGLALDGKGDIFGATNGGGAYGSGADAGGILWELTAAGQYLDLHDFGGTITNASGVSGPDGQCPNGVTMDGSGNLYGTTNVGSINPYSTEPSGDGIVWELTSGGVYKDLHDFGGKITGAYGGSFPVNDGEIPFSGVTLDNAGNLYGTTYYGGANAIPAARGGMVWEITSAGDYVDLHDFASDGFGSIVNSLQTVTPDGTSSQAGVTFDQSGNLYGVCTEGGGDAWGMLWKMTPNVAPIVPSPLKEIPGNNQVSLSWPAVAGATSYNIYRGSTGWDHIYQSGITGTSYTDTNATNGTFYMYNVTAVSPAGEGAPWSSNFGVTPEAPTVSFVTTDTATQGNWKGVYGGESWDVVGDTSVNNPHTASFSGATPSGNSTVTWAASTLSPSALQVAANGSADRIAAAWTAPNAMTLDLYNFDSSHEVALYFLDWGNTGISETVTIADSATGTVLDTRTVSNFGSGTYEVWHINGHVTVTITKNSGANAVLSGVFYGPATGAKAPGVPANLSASETGGQVDLSWTASTGATSYNVYRGTSAGGEDPTPVASDLTQTSYVDQGLTQGATYYYKVVAVNAVGGSFASPEASATIPAPTVTFFNTDMTTQGNWKGVYGGDGWDIAGDPSANNPTIPSYATVSITGDALSVPAPSTTDPRALLKSDPVVTDRVAGMWNAATSETFDLNLADGDVHRIAFYLLDWENSARVQSITITDATTNAVLDTRSVSTFQNGIYDVWDISGHVALTVTYTGSTGSNAAVSGVFFGAANTNPPAAPTGLVATGSTGLTM